MSEDFQSKWDESYRRGENHLFWPAEEVVRFVNKYVRKQTRLEPTLAPYYKLVAPWKEVMFLSLGCGIGRHLEYGLACDFEVRGVDISKTAILYAQRIISAPERYLYSGTSTDLQYEDSFFHVIVSHGTIDSMPFADAQATMLEAWRVLKPGGYFYFNLIEGGDGETVIEGEFEHGTVQTYYTLDKIDDLLSSHPWQVCEKLLNIRHDILRGVGVSRWHVVLRKGEDE